jgi:hypothetical protein
VFGVWALEFGLGLWDVLRSVSEKGGFQPHQKEPATAAAHIELNLHRDFCDGSTWMYSSDWLSYIECQL